jgi:AAA+ superfamily predicted ATPase
MKNWYRVTIAGLQEVAWTRSAMDHLVLQKDKKDLIRNLVEQYSLDDRQIAGDVIAGKGTGLIIVLHGPPGVGKTLTAECIAEYTRKALYPINVGELTGASDITSRLQTIFRRASSWDAILLLDEADVFLERRSFEDFKRNGTVSVFLRMLEYYEGILIMTTNRIKLIDSAFQSRIHVAIEYDALDRRARRKVWANFIKQLKMDEDSEDALMDHLEDMAEWEFNGRQIRNVMSTARSLAKAHGTASKLELSFKHIQAMAKETISFQNYFAEYDDALLERLPIGPRNPKWT